jgi:membrane associated rhomboid family serine protease
VAGTPDLFVVCKNCRAEVSPYITECPYCGARLRKRAPKLDKGGVPRPPKRRRRPSAPSLSRLRPGEMPGVRAEGRPYATLLIVLASVVMTILVKSGILDFVDFVVAGQLPDDPYRYVTTVLIYDSTAYEVVTLASVFVFGWLLERRHGLWAPLLVFVLGQAAGMALALFADPEVLLTGANAGALALLGAWAVRDLRALRNNEEIESDMLGVACVAVLLLLMPAALYEPDPIAGVTGALMGLALGHVLARAPER